MAGESERRVQELLDTALALFLAQGYEATSIEGVAAAAGMAKTTIYRHFGSKKGLFEKVVAMAVGSLGGQLTDVQSGHPTVEDGLRHIAQCLQDIIYQPRSIGLMRLFFSESPRFPELGRAYGSQAKAVFAKEMTAYLSWCVGAGLMDIPDVAVAMEQFHHLVMSSRFIDVLLGVAPVPDSDERDAITTQAVRLFLAGYGVVR